MYRKLLIWSVLFALLLSTLSVATAATPPPPKPVPAAPDDGLRVSLDAQGSGIQNVGTSTLANVTPAFLPIGGAFDLCFTVLVQSPDAEYMDHFDADLPDGWTVNSVAPNSVPPANGCSGALPPVVGVNAGNIVYWQSTGYPPQTGCGAWNGGTGGTNFDFCANVTIPDTTGAPWMLPWLYVGDGWGAEPHQVSGTYGPVGPIPPIYLTPELIEEEGCPCGLQEHELTVWNNAGYDTTVNLSYTLVSGTGNCSGPASVSVPNGTTVAFFVNFFPTGVPGDAVVCEVYAEDASNPANNDTSAIIKHLVAHFFDPAGWQLEPIAGATPNQWAGGAVGFYPAAAGPVGYVVGGLAAGSSIINPDLQMYDPGTGTWTQLADLPNPRFSPVVGWIGGLLYAAGGYDTAFGATGDLQVYDPGTNTWDNTNPADLPVIRGGGAGGVGVCASGAGPCLFHVGGGPDSNFASTTLETWQYNPATDAWTQLDNKPAGSSPDGHILGAGVGCMGQVYVGGDYRGYDHFFRLDATQPPGSQWTQLASMPAGAGSMTPALVCKEEWGQILLIGGDPFGAWSGYNDTVYVYDIATDTWHGPLPQTLHVAQTGSVAWHMYNRVWTAGGTVGSGAIAPMPFESLLQIECDPEMCLELEVTKTAPPVAANGDVIAYTITLTPSNMIPGLFMVDPLPVGVEYAGNLSWNSGQAWYDAGENAVHWEYTGTEKVESPLIPVPRLAPDAAASVDLAGGPEVAGAPAPEGVPIFQFPKGVLWDNGPLVTLPGECGGMDASRLQTDLGMNTLGFGHQLLVGNRMADDFAVDAPLGWQIDEITFFAYQTGAPVTSTITGVYYQIWDGPPNDPASSVVFGDLATNRLLSTAFTDIQRDSGTSPCANNRYIFADVASAGVWLPQGTYWIDWMTDGSLASGPWAPPVTILGQTTTGNALQYTTSSGAWGPANDSGTLTQQDMPFIIEGDPVPMPQITFDVMVTGHCGDVIVNEGVAGIVGVMEAFMATTVVGGEALIAVAPAPLAASVCPDTTGVETLSICNEGDCPLWWSLGELAPAAFAGSMPFTPVGVTASGTTPGGLSLSGPAAGEIAQPAAPRSPDAVLWDQPLSTVNQNAWVDQEFLDFADASSFLADDWTNADPWLVNTIFVPGDGWNGFTSLANAAALTWQIYADHPTTPGIPAGDPAGGGDPPVWTLTLPPHDPHVIITPGSNGLPSDVTLNAPVPIVLPPGDWWLVFYPSAPFGTFGQYGRQAADTTNGYVGQFINPGGFFGLGTGWQDWTVLGGQPPDIAFRLEGAVLPELGDIPWLSQSPISGTLDYGACQDVDVTFDTTGLAAGDYAGELFILSNDLGTPTMAVGVELTVLEPVYGAAFTWSPLGVVAGTPVDLTATVGGGTPPLTYTWDLGDGLGDVGMNVSHVYATAGTYEVELTVENACGVSIFTDTVTVEAGTMFVYLPIVVKNY